MNQLSIEKLNKISKKKKKGFTLVELVIVIAIIAILAAMAIPKLSSMRTNAKVSNDVAAAKNIATIASTLVANGKLNASDSVDVSDNSDNAKAIRNQLDGKISDSGKTEATATKFTVTVGSNDSITVTVGDNELYPDNSGAGRQGYSDVAAGKKTATP